MYTSSILGAHCAFLCFKGWLFSSDVRSILLVVLLPQATQYLPCNYQTGRFREPSCQKLLFPHHNESGPSKQEIYDPHILLTNCVQRIFSWYFLKFAQTLPLKFLEDKLKVACFVFNVILPSNQQMLTHH